MRYLFQKVRAKKHELIKVHFSQPTRVLITSPLGFKKYKDNLTFTYFGGQKSESPYEFKVPSHGDWYVIVEKGTYLKPLPIEASVELVHQLEPPKKHKRVAAPVQDQSEEIEEEAEENKTEE